MTHRWRGCALVTGASAGIGEAFAHALAERGHALVLTARREDRLQQLCTVLRERYGVACDYIAMDLSHPQSGENLCSALQQRGHDIDILINNAGYGVTGDYLASDWAVHQRFLQVMVSAVAELTHRLLPGMVARQRGQIINVASLAGLVPSTAGHTLYGAVKAWMIRFSEALADEMHDHGVTVTAICPGFTYSEFHDVSGTRDLVSRMPKYVWLRADEVAEQALKACERGQTVHINGRFNRAIAWLTRHLPSPFIRWLIKRRARNFRQRK